MRPRRSSTGGRRSRPSRPRLWPGRDSSWRDELLSDRWWRDDGRSEPWCCFECDAGPCWWRRSDPKRFRFPDSCLRGGGRMLGPSQPISSSSPSILSSGRPKQFLTPTRSNPCSGHKHPVERIFKYSFSQNFKENVPKSFKTSWAVSVSRWNNWNSEHYWTIAQFDTQRWALAVSIIPGPAMGKLTGNKLTLSKFLILRGDIGHKFLFSF